MKVPRIVLRIILVAAIITNALAVGVNLVVLAARQGWWEWMACSLALSFINAAFIYIYFRNLKRVS